jgi:signal peptidase
MSGQTCISFMLLCQMDIYGREAVQIGKRRVSGKTAVRSAIIVGWIVLLYLIGNTSLLPQQGSLAAYLIRPLLWLGLFFLVKYLFGYRDSRIRRLQKYVCFLALSCGLLHLIGMVLGGMLEAFGKSPFSFSVAGILTNIFFVGGTICGTEYSRAYLIRNWNGNKPFLALLTVSSAYTVLGLSLRAALNLNSLPEAVNFAGTLVLPGLADNMLTTYLAFLGGPLPAWIYQGIVQGFKWFCPILPDLGWTSKTLLGTMIPFFSLLLVQYFYGRETGEEKRKSRRSRDRESPAVWFLTSAAAVLIVWFAVGLLPVYPTVIVTGSMHPLIEPGDIILLKKTDSPPEKGDVIHFRQGGIDIAHRVIEVKGQAEKQYLTKGDNNPSADTEPVKLEQIKGTLISVIPKLGWPALFIRSEDNEQI